MEETRDWQDISTAPKDGTRVVLFTPPADHESEAIGAWAEDGWANRPGWYMDAGDVWTRPTHWQPLPTPPNTTT